MPVLERLFLHIGIAKTGTKTLQLAMDRNRGLLRQHGFLYPVLPGLRHLGLALYAAGEGPMSDIRAGLGLAEASRSAAFLDEFVAGLHGALAAPDIHTAVLSCEECSTGLRSVEEIARLYRLLSPLARELRVIVYLHRQDELAVSLYTAAMKWGRTHEFRLQGRRWFDYLRLLDLWAAVFGRDKLVIRIFEPAQLHRDGLLADFSAAIGFESYEELQRPPDQNTSLNVHALEFLRRFNAHVPPVTEGRPNPNRGDIAEAIGALPMRERLAPSAETAASFLAIYAESNAQVARKYLGRANGVLFAEQPRDRPERLPALTVDQTVEIAAGLWQWQQRRARQQGDEA